MQKAEYVYEWLNARFDAEVRRSFTAGECARAAGVSVNTAKKWLYHIASVPGAMLEYWDTPMANGKIATSFNFTEEARASWK